jgi:hypothetical protein
MEIGRFNMPPLQKAHAKQAIAFSQGHFHSDVSSSGNVEKTEEGTVVNAQHSGFRRAVIQKRA